MIRVLLVDDERFSRTALKLLLAPEADIEVVAEATDGDEVLEAVHAHRPDVVVMDLRMARVDGITATRRVRALSSPPAVVALTSFEIDDDALAVLHAGADSFVLKDRVPEDLAAAIRAAHAGTSVLSPDIARRLVERMRTDQGPDRAAAQRALARLTDRQLEIAAAVHAGRTNPEIAADTFTSASTVKSHLSDILARLDLSSRGDLMVLVERAGGIPRA